MILSQEDAVARIRALAGSITDAAFEADMTDTLNDAFARLVPQEEMEKKYNLLQNQYRETNDAWVKRYTETFKSGKVEELENEDEEQDDEAKNMTIDNLFG